MRRSEWPPLCGDRLSHRYAETNKYCGLIFFKHPTKEDVVDLSEVLINGKGLAERYSVSTSLISNWQRRFPDFPIPLDLPLVIGIPIWDVRVVDAWIKVYRPYLEGLRINKSL